MIPSDLSDLLLWLDADAIAGLSDGDPVGTWEDQSGNGFDYTSNNAAITYETNVLNGLPVVKMEVGGFTGSAVLAVRPYSIYYVARYTVGGTDFHRAIQGSNNWLLGPWQGSWQWFAGGFATGALAADTNWVVHSCIASSAAEGLGGFHRIYDVDTTTTLSTGTLGDGLSSPGTISLGNAGALNEPMGGEIAEIIIFSRRLPPGEDEGMVSYLREKWGNVAIVASEAHMAREAVVVAHQFPGSDTEAHMAREAVVVAHHYPEANTAGLLASLRLVVAISNPHGWYAFDDNFPLPPGQIPTEPGQPGDTVAPAPPTGLMATGGPGEVVLDWDDNVEGDFASYAVYIATDGAGPFTLLAIVSDSDYVATGLSANTEYWFKVVARDTSGNQSLFSSVASATTDVAGGDVTPPPIPTGLGIVANDGAVTLDWDDSPAGDFASFRVYRALSSGGPWVVVATRTVSDFVNTGLVNGTVYFFRVSAVDTTGNESLPSGAVAAKPTSSTDTTSPPTPTGVSATASTSSISVDWSDSTAVDIDFYKVYRATAAGGPYGVIATPSASVYVDSAVSANVTYYYRITAVDTAGNESEQSVIVSATVPPVVVVPPPSGGDSQPTYADRAITINLGDDFDTKINSVSVGTIIGVAPGVHLIDTSGKQFSPRNGEVLVGQVDSNGAPLSIIRGNWDLTQNGTGIESPFPWANTGLYSTDVKLIRLGIERFACELQQAAINGGDDWLLHKVHVNHNKSVGVRLGDHALLFGSKVYRNGQLGIKNKTAADGCIIDTCEVYENNFWDWHAPGFESGGMKFIGQDPINCIVRRSHYHHNHGPGIWYDDHGVNGLIEDNLSEYNLKAGIFYEISTGPALIRRNVSHHNGGAADIYIANSRGFIGSPIIVESNRTWGENSIWGIGLKDDGNRAPRLGYVTVRWNKVYRQGTGRCAGNFGSNGATGANAPGMSINENDYYTNLTNAWTHGGVGVTWNQWRAAGFDTAGTLSPYKVPA